jgi:hypothetical protein
MAITTLGDVKEYLKITDEASDVAIGRLIPYCEQKYLEIRNAPWDIVDSTVVYPVGADIVVSEMIGWKLATSPGAAAIKSESLTSYAVTYNFSKTINGFPSDIVAGIKKFVRAL